MLGFLAYAVIYGVMMFIWSFVYLNKSNDKVNQSFLYFISLVILWMVLSIAGEYRCSSAVALVLKSVYWISMMNLAVFFLLFTCRLVGQRLWPWFYVFAGINTLMIAARYLFPIDYSDPSFWRLSLPVVAPLMAFAFSLPAAAALYLLVRRYVSTKDPRQKRQLALAFSGLGLASVLGVVSEYLLPLVFQIDTHLTVMYLAILALTLCLFVSIMKFKLLNLRSEYVYRTLLFRSPEGTILVDRYRRVLCANDAAKEVLRSGDIKPGDPVTDHIPGYAFEPDYQMQNFIVPTAQGEICVALTQYPVDREDRFSPKMMTLTDVTLLKQEKDLLVEKSITDPLTGFYNKQYFIERYDGRPGIGEGELSVLFIDIDGFKAVNDLCGHAVGDQLLISLAARVRESVGEDAKTVRFGGDEFVVLLKNSPPEEALRVAERIRRGACEMDVSCYGENVRLTLSIGVASGKTLKTRSVSALIRKADAAMYRSKNAGKNKVTVFAEEDENT